MAHTHRGRGREGGRERGRERRREGGREGEGGRGREREGEKEREREGRREGGRAAAAHAQCPAQAQVDTGSVQNTEHREAVII